MSKAYIISDTHLKHDEMQTYCDRPANFTERIHRNVMNTVRADDYLIHVGDVGIGKAEDWAWMVREWPGKKLLVRGNHDTGHSPTWWLRHGFDSVCDGMIFRGVWVTHRPAASLPARCNLNLHGHLHNVWHGFNSDECTRIGGCLKKTVGPTTRCLCDILREKLRNPWQRLFAVEYTNYMPVEWDKFFAQPNRYQATGRNYSLDSVPEWL